MTLTPDMAAQPAPMPALERKMFKPAELHEQYSVPLERIHNALKARELAGYNMGSAGKRPRWLVSREDFEAWMGRAFYTGAK